MQQLMRCAGPVAEKEGAHLLISTSEDSQGD